MTLAATLLPEFDHEMVNTRRTLERLPEDRFGWRPHEKSMTLAELATHIANLPHWAVITVQGDSFDMAPPGEEPVRATEVTTVAEALATFDRNAAAARATITDASDERLLGPWSLLNGGQVAFTMPRVAVLRSFVLNHTIHHRAQLGVYLRLCDVPVPALYGPSADESP